MDLKDFERAQELISSKQMTLKQWAEGYATFHGGAAQDWESAYVARMLVNAQASAQQSLRKVVESYSVPKRLVRALRLCETFSSEYNTKAVIVFELSEDKQSAKALLVSKRAKRTNSSDSTSSNSRISAWVAYNRTREEDKTARIDIRKNADGTYTDQSVGQNVDIGRKRGGLAGYAVRQYPNSAWAALILKYKTKQD